MKTVHIDHLLKIGKTHKICEDYIISGYDPVPYIILSDGCSSSKNTDIGARILCHRAKQYLQQRTDSFDSINAFEMGDYIIWASKLAIDLLGLDVTALDATLIIAYYYDGLININMYGDGHIVNIHKNDITIKNIEYSKNTPYYLSYKLDPKRDGIYRDNKIIKMVDKHYIDNPYTAGCTQSLVAGMMDYKKPYISSHKINPNKDQTIFIFSDGISTFFNKEQSEFLPIKDLIQDFSSFKTLKGEFLQRRLLSKKGAITKLEQQGYEHLDDLSIGAFVTEGD
jgi:hypothetical protein